MNVKFVFGMAVMLMVGGTMSVQAQYPPTEPSPTTPLGAPYGGLPGFSINMMQPSPVGPPPMPGSPKLPPAQTVPMPPMDPMNPIPMTKTETQTPAAMNPGMAPTPQASMSAPTSSQAMFQGNPLSPDGLHAAHFVTDSPAESSGPVGLDGPIGEEIYFRVGPSFGLSGAKLDNLTQTGLAVNFGLKTLLFNREQDRAWAIDIGILYQRNNGESDPVGMPLFSGFVNLRSLTRTSVNIGLGREWWMLHAANCHDATNWRFGIDMGGRYGSAHGDFGVIGNPTAYVRRNDVFGGYYIGINNTLEVPVGGWHALFGLRTEYGATYGDIVPSGGNQIHDLNVWFTTGLRF